MSCQLPRLVALSIFMVTLVGICVAADVAPHVGRPVSAEGLEQGGSDWGDAPPPYPVTLGQNGARHAVPAQPNVNRLQLGLTIDVEPDGQPSPLATADGNPDEDGVSIPSFYIGLPVTIPVVVTMPGLVAGLLDVWVDYNSDGDWNDPGEHPFVMVGVAAGTNFLTAMVPAGATQGITYARFRLRTAGALTPLGPANDGEVEDYAIRICDVPPPPETCAHIMFVFDYSNSMAGAKLALAAAAVGTFVNSIAMPPAQVGLINFNDTPPVVDAPLGSTAAAIIAALPVAAAGDTHPAAAITLADGTLAGAHAPDCEDVIIFLSDGQPWLPPPAPHEAAALDAGTAAKGNGIRIITIGIAPDAAGDAFLTALASPGDYHRAPTPAQLQQIIYDLLYDVAHAPPPPPCQPPLASPGGADLGDAPDSTNHYQRPMTAYVGVSASFPTVFDLLTGIVPGPKHRAPMADIWLGELASLELDADLLPDEDRVENILPPMNQPDRDWGDDGVAFPLNLPQCLQTTFSYTVTVAAGPNPRYANAWLDFSRDGDWADTLQCFDPQRGTVSVPEWVVQDQLLNLPPGTHLVQTPLFDSYDPGGEHADLWMRINVSEQLAPSPGDGRGPSAEFAYGETEDYLLHYDGTAQGYRPDAEP